MKSSHELLAERRKKRREKYKAEIELISFEKYCKDYVVAEVYPFVCFFKFLAARPEDIQEMERKCEKSGRQMTRKKLESMKLKLWLPDTIVIGDSGCPPMWFYTAEDGFVYRTDSFTAKHVVAKLGNYASPDELVAVLKNVPQSYLPFLMLNKPYFHKRNMTGNTIQLVSTRDLSMIASGLLGRGGRSTVLQKFVKAAGPKAFICRTHWREGRNPQTWTITNKNGYYEKDKRGRDGKKVPEVDLYCAQPKKMGSCSIVHSYKGIFLKQTLAYIDNLLKYLYTNSGARFSEMICDFVKDESGTWWLINVKGFRIKTEIPHTLKDIYSEQKSESYQEKKKKKLSIVGH